MNPEFVKFIKAIFISISLFSSFKLISQDIRYLGIFQSYSQNNHFNKINWLFNFSNLLNPKDLNFEQLDYPSADIRLQIVNILHYSLTSDWRLSIGLHYQRNFPFDSRYSTEYRPFEQAEFDHFLGKIKITHMLRFNQRWTENKLTNSYPLSLTFQYKTQIKYILKNYALNHKNLYLTAYSEEYVTLSGPLKFQIFSEYWAYAGLGFQWNKNLKLEAGIGHEWLVRNSNLDIRSIIYPSINLISNFKWR